MLNLFFDFILGRMVIDQVKYHGVDSRLDSIEEILNILTPGGVPVQGVYTFGDWTQNYEQVIEFAAWAA